MASTRSLARVALLALSLLAFPASPAAAEPFCFERGGADLLCVEPYQLPNGQDCLRVYASDPADPFVRACAGLTQPTHCVDLTHPGVPGLLAGACAYPTVESGFACANLYLAETDQLVRQCAGPLDAGAFCHDLIGLVSTGACLAAGPAGDDLCAHAYASLPDQAILECVGPGSGEGCFALSVDVDAEACARVRENAEGKDCPRLEAEVTDLRGSGEILPRRVVEPVCVGV